jgi:hypothetical protein
VDINRLWGCSQLLTVLRLLQHLKSLPDCGVGLVQLSGSSIGIDGVRDLVVARFVQTSKIEPDFTDVGIESDRSRVGVQGVSVLVDLVIEYTDRAPEGGVAAVSVDCLLVRFVGLVVSLRRHVCSTKEVPALGIISVCSVSNCTERIRPDLPASRLRVKYCTAFSLSANGAPG